MFIAYIEIKRRNNMSPAMHTPQVEMYRKIETRFTYSRANIEKPQSSLQKF